MSTHDICFCKEDQKKKKKTQNIALASLDKYFADLFLSVPLVQVNTYFTTSFSSDSKQEAYGPQLAHLSETATANMQMACNIFPIMSNIETYDKAMG